MCAAMRWRTEPDAASPQLSELQRDLDAVLHGPRSRARERAGRKRFYRVEDGLGGPALLVKVFAAPPGLAAYGRSKARREAASSRRAAARGFRVAQPLATGEQRRAGRLERSVSVVQELPLRDLRAVLQDPATAPETRRAHLLSFAELNRRLHDAGIDQDDSSPNNFLVDPDGDWVLIDFERCRLRRKLGRRRWRLLAKLHRHRLGVSQSERLRFLRVYLGAGSSRAERRAAWSQIRLAFLAVRRRDARHAARAAFRPGRHLDRSGASWVVKGREDVPVIRLSLDAPRARAIWTLCHVFERLALPALRPVRLDETGVELQVPEIDEQAMEFHAAVARARRSYDPYGSWVREPQWALTACGAVLLTPDAFKLRI